MTGSSFYLHTSHGCHLCEMAEQLLQLCLGDDVARVQAVEISESDDLIASYGLRIPVVAGTSASGEWIELGWPFGAQDLQEFLAALRS